MLRYYSIHRPVGPGTYPRAGHTVLGAHNFEHRQQVPDIGREAWGYIDFAEPLTEKEAEQYELVGGELKTWWAVTSSIDDRGHVVATVTDFVSAVRQPESIFKSTRDKDIYIDYYPSHEEAEQAAREARNA